MSLSASNILSIKYMKAENIYTYHLIICSLHLRKTMQMQKPFPVLYLRVPLTCYTLCSDFLSRIHFISMLPLSIQFSFKFVQILCLFCFQSILNSICLHQLLFLITINSENQVTFSNSLMIWHLDYSQSIITDILIVYTDWT